MTGRLEVVKRNLPIPIADALAAEGAVQTYVCGGGVPAAARG
jgi:hypothetical protein